MKILMLIRPKHLFHTVESRSTEGLNFQFRDPREQQEGVKMHKGPIFSLCWVGAMGREGEKERDDLREALGDEDDEQKGFLVSGSADRCVRV